MALSSILNLLHIYASDRARTRGVSDYELGAVLDLSCSDRFVFGTVSDQREHDVRVEIREDTLVVSCDCAAHADRHELCKHIVSLLVAAEIRGHMLTRGRAPLRHIVARGGSAKVATRTWRDSLKLLSNRLESDARPAKRWLDGREIVYVVDFSDHVNGGDPMLTVAQRGAKPGSKPRRVPTARDADLATLAEPVDRELLSYLMHAQAAPGWYRSREAHAVGGPHPLGIELQKSLLPRIAATGRLLVDGLPASPPLQVVRLDSGGPWSFTLDLARGGEHYLVTGSLDREGERIDITAPLLLLASGFMFTPGLLARFDHHGAYPWVHALRNGPTLEVALGEGAELVERLYELPRLPPIAIPDELQIDQVVCTPRPCLTIRAPQVPPFGKTPRLPCEFAFDYDGVRVPVNTPGSHTRDPARRRVVVRDRVAEAAATARLEALRFRWRRDADREEPQLELLPSLLRRVVPELIADGFEVRAEGKVYRQGGRFRLGVASGIDWFEVSGTMEFGELSAELPALMLAAKRGDNTVLLGDGSVGILPAGWLKRFGMLATNRALEDGSLRFGRNQIGVLDALLAIEPDATWDESFAHARAALEDFAGVAPVNPEPSFTATLRPYQKQGLGWLLYLERFGFGGCLADDMGLGKTAQVLALLNGRRARAVAAGDDPGPALVVAPRSIVYHWKQEAQRFAPTLRVLDYSGADRATAVAAIKEHDLVLATYGTLRRDILKLKELEFDYAIIDEAQAIKNADSETAKAVRLLRAQHRLALSGTPIENHLGELWSLFEFLNPGILGKAKVFQSLVATVTNPDDEQRTLLRRALKPFFLRRTKEAVAPDLPDKTEETVYCELGKEQRRLYDEIRDHYRQSLLSKVEASGMNRVKMHVLEALLRLRQAACHPALIDKTRRGHRSAKLEMLIPELAEVVEEGHKALVFSQFTSMLSLVRDELDREKIVYEYLDGRTTDRKERVERFQSDDACRVFLISLKAGGVGLNLTAADYVFLLDPWWNPAVEVQAIDRTHRIGQTKNVFAYRLIAKDTIEERVLELQAKKRDLADAILGGGSGPLKGLTREDLELLLS